MAGEPEACTLKGDLISHGDCRSDPPGDSRGLETTVKPSYRRHWQQVLPGKNLPFTPAVESMLERMLVLGS